MMKIALTICAVAMTVNANAFDINSYCGKVADAAGGSYQIEQICRQQEAQARSNVNSMSVSLRIKNYCTEVGQAAGGSYQIMEVCIQQESQAKSNLY